MSLERYFTDANLAIDKHVLLTDDQAKHCRTVMRNKPGDKVILFNGQGGEYIAEIENITKKDVQLRITEFIDIQRVPSAKIFLLTAVPKLKRFDFLVEKATELGVTEIIPLKTKRSDNFSSGLNDSKLERYNTKIVEACKQCGRNILPKISSAKSLETALNLDADLKVVLHPYVENFKIEQNVSAPTSIVLAVGPEGGFTEEEIQMFQNSGWKGLTIGQSILRVETAAISALSIINHFLDNLM